MEKILENHDRELFIGHLNMYYLVYSLTVESVQSLLSPVFILWITQLERNLGDLSLNHEFYT